LLQQAFIHSSFVNENPSAAAQSNERLEFLGDAVLGLVVADELYQAFPSHHEGILTEQRTHLVRRDTLAEAARDMDLGAHLLLGKGEEAGGGRARPTNLAHAYEAVVGAIFLDRGLEAARTFVLASLAPHFQSAASNTSLQDPKSRLQELSQSTYQATPVYRLIEAKGPDHDRSFTVEVVVDGKRAGRGTGHSKQQAEKAAALQALEGLAPGENGEESQ
jgi:ribonuclease-3